MEWLNGKKTYIVATLMFINAGGQALGWWDVAYAEHVNAILIPLGLAFLRVAVSKGASK